MGASQATGPTRAETTAHVLGTGRWRVLADRSRIGFRVKKMGVYYVKGRFRGVDGELGPDGHGEVVVDAGSISTRIAPRDWHLRSRDFLDVRRHPKLRASVESVEPAGDGGIAAAVVLNLHGERAPVELRGHLHHLPEPDGNGDARLLVHLEGKLDRHQFGIRARPPVEWIVGREVLLDVELGLERIPREDPAGEAPPS
jgi:polyisoprenoid-binding protein YceI